MKLLHILPSLDPEGGGPMEGVLRSGQACESMGHQVEVLTLDDAQAPFLRNYPLPLHAIGPSRGGYRYNERLVPWLREHGANYDAIVVNGLWQYHSFGAWRALRHLPVPYVVYPHGMLDPWFKQAHPLKHLKKWLYWPWAEYRLLRDAAAVLFTTEEERRLAPQSFWLYRARPEVVGFGATTPPADSPELRRAFAGSCPETAGKRVLLYLSRLHEKKGCDLLLEAYARCARDDPSLHLVMAGPDHTGLRPKLEAQARSLGVAERISWPGMLTGDAKWGAFYASAAYVLPSHQENFGIAVAEALGCGLPVLISNKVNIWREIQDDGAGIVDEDTTEGTERSLRRWLSLNANEIDALSQRARACFQRHFTADAMASGLMSVLLRLPTAGSAPFSPSGPSVGHEAVERGHQRPPNSDARHGTSDAFSVPGNGIRSTK